MLELVEQINGFYKKAKDLPLLEQVFFPQGRFIGNNKEKLVLCHS